MKNPTLSKSLLFVLLFTLIGVVLYAMARPHFVDKVNARLVDNEAQLSFKETGLEADQNITYRASAEATATYVCVNDAQQCPDPSNKKIVRASVSGGGTFNSGTTDSIAEALRLDPPGEREVHCPNGQTSILGSVIYSDITMTDITHGILAAAVPSTISADNFAPASCR